MRMRWIAIAAFAADVTGKWVGQVPGRDGQMRETTLNLKADGSNLTGTVKAKETVEVRPRVSGYIQEVKFKEGEEVKQDQPLFVIG